MEFSAVFSMLVFGFFMGIIYSGLALGYNIVYRVSKAINLAEPEVVLLVAYLVFLFVNVLGLHIALSFLAAIPISFVIGIALDRAFIRPLRGRPPEAVIAMTLGLFFLIRGIALVVTRGFEPGAYPYPLRIYDLGPVSVTFSDIASLLLAGSVVIGIVLLHKYTKIGAAMRAASEDPIGAASYGIPVKTLATISWGLAGLVMGISALALASKTQLNAYIDFYALKALVVSLLAGLDSLGGVVVAGVALGIIEQIAGSLLDPILPGFGERVVFPLMLVILFIKPYGLFGTERIERV